MMIHRWLPACIMFWAVVLVKGAAAQGLPRVMIQTELGSMEVEVDTIRTPDAAGIFLMNVDRGAYKGGHFYRTVRAERVAGGKTQVEGIEGGSNPSRTKNAPSVALKGMKDTGLSDGEKVLSLGGDGLGGAASEFFIRIGHQPDLGRLEPDGRGFTPFGRVVRGREVVRLIHTARARDHALTPPIGILDARRVR
ncbi:MAG TPA: peptidylprolyl isomerase [Gemmatimonadales bacterium]|nr:peptidylprolyl isomerase [Gemmatimonadales bacterium]